MIYYTYYSFEKWGRGYIGSRQCASIKSDTSYLGSFKDPDFRPTEKIIISFHKSREEAYQAEKLLHDFFEVEQNPHFANLCRASTQGLTKSGWKHSKEARRKIGDASRGNNYTAGKNHSQEVCEHRYGLDYENIWKEVLQAMANANGSYHWGGAQIAKKHGVSRRFIAKFSKAIREGKSFSQWRNWL